MTPFFTVDGNILTLLLPFLPSSTIATLRWTNMSMMLTGMLVLQSAGGDLLRLKREVYNVSNSLLIATEK